MVQRTRRSKTSLFRLLPSLVPEWVFFSAAVISAILALGFFDPRPLILRLEQTQRPSWFLAVNAAGVVLFVLPYVLAAAHVPLSQVPSLTPWLLAIGYAAAALGFLLWLSSPMELASALKQPSALVIIAVALAPFAANELEGHLWKASIQMQRSEPLPFL